MRETRSAATEHPRLGWSHRLLLVVAFVCSRPTTAFPTNDDNPLYEFGGTVRLRHLYTSNANTYMHLQITSDGEVSGTQDQNVYSILEIKSVNPGILVFRGLKSSRYLCMDQSGHQYGSVAYTEEDCNFREKLTKDGFSTFFSEKHQGPLALQPPQGEPLTQFLPRENEIPLHLLNENPPTHENHPTHEMPVNEEDPLGVLTPTNSRQRWE